MSVKVKFLQSGPFNAGEFRFLDLEKITQLRISHQRINCELHAITPENPRPATPFVIAQRDRLYEIQAIFDDLVQLRQETKDIIYEITSTEAHRVK